MTTPAPAAPQPAAPLSEAEDKQWASFAHFGNIILLVPALIIWLVFTRPRPQDQRRGQGGRELDHQRHGRSSSS